MSSLAEGNFICKMEIMGNTGQCHLNYNNKLKPQSLVWHYSYLMVPISAVSFKNHKKYIYCHLYNLHVDLVKQQQHQLVTLNYFRIANKSYHYAVFKTGQGNFLGRV